MGKRRWVTIACSIALVLMFWLAAAFTLDTAFAGSLAFPLQIASRLSADYSGDDPDQVLAAFNLSIIGEAFKDFGLIGADSETDLKGLEDEMDDPVPTATARDFEGNSPFTATATHTPTATPSPSPTPTSTSTATPLPTS